MVRNTNKIKAKIVENGLTIKEFAPSGFAY